MKRKRKSKTLATQITKEDENIEQMGPSIRDLPKSVVQDVLLKLPPKSIVMCKCVCKTWRDLIMDPRFAKLHFAQAEACVLVQPWVTKRVSRTLYMVDPEAGSGFDLKDNGASEVDEFHLPMSISKWKILLLNDEEEAVNCHYDGIGTKGKSCIEIHPQNHSYKMVNSCNGLLCLSGAYFKDPLVVCNPVTGEFVKLPKASKNEGDLFSIRCGLGFSPKNNQFKVLRIFMQTRPQPIRLFEIHTLGTSSWTSLVRAPPSADWMREDPTYLKGALYWITFIHNLDYIVSFDFDNEQFQSVPPPPFPLENFGHVSLGVLGGCLCVCNAHDNLIDVWVREDCGAQKSWTKWVSINFEDTCPHGLYKPIKYLHNGGLLMFHPDTTTLIDYHSRNYRLIYLYLRGLDSVFDAISHAPSFISLKDILMGDDVEVMYINSRYAECKLPGESRGLALEEKDADMLLKVIPRWGVRN